MPSALQQQMKQLSLPEIYEHYVNAGKLRPDDAQRAITARLEQLRTELASLPVAKPGPAPKKLLGKLRSTPPTPSAARSIYIWGDVGRGKSLLMDMFYKFVEFPQRRRVHFHNFMLEIHSGTHAFRHEHPKENPVEHVAVEMAARHHLICLDELQVTDVADAMILHKLFKTMLDKGVTFVITSNRPPEDLYKGGLQREKFLEFVDLVHQRMDVLQLDAMQDYRLQQVRALQKVYFYPHSEQADQELHELFTRLTRYAERSEGVLEVQGRKIPVHESYGGTALFTFQELCEQPLGAADYLAIARTFNVVVLQGIPRLTPEKRNEARRFVTLIDALYDHRVKLLCTAEADPDALYPQGDGTFEFKRTASRLIEMQSEYYLEMPHLPEG